ncbi:MAG: DUF3179 domain-containing protein [Chloroflexi bacterium]|jgi:hypothetical protein|nr:DUF3179 domain-containing protein [Chloroflexota bacterium]MBT7081341.1 DUF3179 domain-containing protein [Chloroflexota bacterium]MBT7290813.1 DUF3179 domain-containing protein [Chloroflexota bacterium]
MKRRYFALFVLMIVIMLFASLTACGQPDSRIGGLVNLEGASNVGDEYDIITDPSGVKYIVHPNKIVGGGPPKDGIPSIDNPKYVSIAQADQWIQDDELVLGIIYKGVKRVYPLQIMVWHEIVNDTIAGDPLLVTY